MCYRNFEKLEGTKLDVNVNVFLKNISQFLIDRHEVTSRASFLKIFKRKDRQKLSLFKLR